jgi:hypothetical protein
MQDEFVGMLGSDVEFSQGLRWRICNLEGHDDVSDDEDGGFTTLTIWLIQNLRRSSSSDTRLNMMRTTDLNSRLLVERYCHKNYPNWLSTCDRAHRVAFHLTCVPIYVQIDRISFSVKL